jgi:hypothetical protein
MELMRAGIASEKAGTGYKHDLPRYEPWKLVVVAAGAGCAVVTALVTLLRAFGH